MRRPWRARICIVLIVFAVAFVTSLVLMMHLLGRDLTVRTRGTRGQHSLCLLVPFRDRSEELSEFIPHLGTFLRQQNIDFSVYVMSQVDDLRFNRAMLINAGFLFTEGGRDPCDYVGLHDVDLLPLNPNLSYRYPEGGVLHVSPPGLHPKYDFETFLGGILLVQKKHFKLLNGMSNRFWGWGLEDDEFRARIVDANLTISKPKDISSGRERTFRHVHSAKKRKRDMRKCYNQRDVTRRRDRETGMNSTDYQIKAVKTLELEGVPYHLVDVVLGCDRRKTPWCSCEGAPEKEAPLTFLDPRDKIIPNVKKKVLDFRE